MRGQSTDWYYSKSQGINKEIEFVFIYFHFKFPMESLNSKRAVTFSKVSLDKLLPSSAKQPEAPAEAELCYISTSAPPPPPPHPPPGKSLA